MPVVSQHLVKLPFSPMYWFPFDFLSCMCFSHPCVFHQQIIASYLEHHPPLWAMFAFSFGLLPILHLIYHRASPRHQDYNALQPKQQWQCFLEPQCLLPLLLHFLVTFSLTPSSYCLKIVALPLDCCHSSLHNKNVKRSSVSLCTSAFGLKIRFDFVKSFVNKMGWF